jgi:hypothetical protein
MSGLSRGWSLAAGVALLLCAREVWACGPLIDSPIWEYESWPGEDPAAFAAGKLGLVRGTYAPGYKVIAYRILSGHPLNSATQEEAVRAWQRAHHRLSHLEVMRTAVGRWTQAVRSNFGAKVDPGVPEVVTDVGVHTWTCLPDAFVTATRTLQDRVRKSRRWARRWAEQQAQVFRICTQGETETALLATPEGAPKWLVKDAAYQRAAAAFYRHDFASAEPQFRAIAADPASSWRAIAAHVAVRAVIRTATLDRGDYESNMKRAVTELRALLKNRTFASAHPAMMRSLSFALINSETSGWEEEIARLMDRPDVGTALPALALDFDSSNCDAGCFQNPKFSDQWEWVFTFDKGPTQFAKARERWLKRKSLPWLLAMLSNATKLEELPEEALPQTREVPPTSPGYLTAHYHSARLLIASGKREEAQSLLSQLLDGDLHLQLSDRNRLARLRTLVPASAEQAFADALRYVVEVDEEDGLEHPGRDRDGTVPAQYFDEEGYRAVTASITAPQLFEISQTSRCPNRLRRTVTLTAWARALIVGDDATAEAAANALLTLDPASAPAFQQWLSEAPSDRRFAGALLIAKRPGISPYAEPGFNRFGESLFERHSFGQNWWCSPTRPHNYFEHLRYDVAFAEEAAPRRYEVVVPAHATPEEAETLRREWAALVEAGAGPNFLTREFLARAKSHPRDPRIPEGLHYAVRAVRYSCRDEGTDKASRAAFRHLHFVYPKSEWTKQTPYRY